MDAHQVYLKLRYVLELLNDLRHYHQSSSHACSCSVCCQKQVLARSIVANAFQEITHIAYCIQKTGNGDILLDLPTDKTLSGNSSCGHEQDECNIVSDADFSKHRQCSSNEEMNYSSNVLCELKDHGKSSCSDLLKDSGLNTSLSVSPVLHEKHLCQKVCKAYVPESNVTNKTRDLTMNETGIVSPPSFTCNVISSIVDKNILSLSHPSVHSGTLCSSVEQTSHMNNTHIKTNIRNPSLHPSLKNLPVYAEKSSAAMTPQNEFLSFVMPSAGLHQELEKHLEAKLPAAASSSVEPLTMTKAFLPVPKAGKILEPNKYLNKTEDSITEQRVSLVCCQTCCPQNGVKCQRDNSKMIKSSCVKEDLINNSHCCLYDKIKDGQQNLKSDRNKCCSLQSHEASVLCTQTECSACSYQLHFNENTANLNNSLRESSQSANKNDQSSRKAMWRPWEVKDMILALIASEAEEVGKQNISKKHKSPTVSFNNTDFATNGSDTNPNAGSEICRKLSVNRSKLNSNNVNDTHTLESSHVHFPQGQLMFSVHSKETDSCDRLDAGYLPSCSSSGNPFTLVKEIHSDIISPIYEPPDIFKCDTEAPVIYDVESNLKHTKQELLDKGVPADTDRSLKCVSNVLLSSRRASKPIKYRNPVEDTGQEIFNSLSNDNKENGNTKPYKFGSKVTKAVYQSPDSAVSDIQHGMSHMNISVHPSAHVCQFIPNNLETLPSFISHPQKELTGSQNQLSEKKQSLSPYYSQPLVDSQQTTRTPYHWDSPVVVVTKPGKALIKSPGATDWTSRKPPHWGAPAVVSTSEEACSKKKQDAEIRLKNASKLGESRYSKPVRNKQFRQNPQSSSKKLNTGYCNSRQYMSNNFERQQNLDALLISKNDCFRLENKNPLFEYELEENNSYIEETNSSKIYNDCQMIAIQQEQNEKNLQERDVGLNKTFANVIITKDMLTPTMMNLSYEANQSFPKMIRQQKSACETVTANYGQAVVSDLNQLPSEWPVSITPRNRRSVFCFSPLDAAVSPKDGETVQSLASLKLRSPDNWDDLYLQTLWSLLDVTKQIGSVPSMQEILFNSATSSLCIVDPSRNGKIMSVNESFQFMIGVHEKVVGQKLFRFVKLKDPVEESGHCLPQSFILANGQVSNVTGKMAVCITACGEQVEVIIWTVPCQPQPQLTVCVLGVAVQAEMEVYLSPHGDILMCSEPCQIENGTVQHLEYSLVDRPQAVSVQTADGFLIPVTVTLKSSNETVEAAKQVIDQEDASIYFATLSVIMNMSGLLIVGPDGHVRQCDRNFFRINLGWFNLEQQHISELFAEVTKVNSGQSPTSPEFLDQSGSNTSHELACDNVSRQHSQKSNRNTGLYLPKSCFSSHGLLVMDHKSTEEESDNDEDYSDDDVDCEDNENSHTHGTVSQRYDSPIASEFLVMPHQASTPCKRGELRKKKSNGNVVLKNGVYLAVCQHRNKCLTPVSFKLSRIQTTSETLFCFWIYIKPHTGGEDIGNDDSNNGDGDSDEDDDGVQDKTEEIDDEDDDEEEDHEIDEFVDQHMKQRMQNLYYSNSFQRAGEISLGQQLMEKACLNQSHNATSEADILDLEAAVEGSFSEKYMVCEALGQGSFGFVRRARVLESPETVVVKFIKKKKMFQDSWMADVQNRHNLIPLEVAILREVDHEHVIKLVDFHENGSFVQLVMEDFGETDLFDFIDQVVIDESLACHLFRQILEAVEYLHSKKIVHRDIKDENVVVSRDFHCKLIDFGSAAYMLPEGELFLKFRGTMEYCSPEVYHGASYRGPELDAWALGVTLYTILFRENPFSESDVPGPLKDLPFSVSEDVTILILALLEPDPSKRLTVRGALSSDWVRQIVNLNDYQWQDMFGDVPAQSHSLLEM